MARRFFLSLYLCQLTASAACRPDGLRLFPIYPSPLTIAFQTTDLTYICDRLIAMSLPCVGGVYYRNDIRDVGKFFANFHYGSFLVVNLCEVS